MRMSFILAAALAAVPAPAKGPAILIDGWARAGINTASAYIDIRNDGATADQLVSISTPAARSTSIHATTALNGVSRMRPVGVLTISPNGRLQMKPGGLHVMLVGLKAPLRPGTKLPLTLRFAKAGTTRVSVPVLAAGANPAAGGGHAH